MTDRRQLLAHLNPGPGPCEACEAPAVCFGAYEDPQAPVVRGCEECCGHGNEDGWCEPILEETE